MAMQEYTMSATPMAGLAPARWLTAALADWVILMGAIALAIHVDHPVSYVVALFLVGNRQHALGILGHDGAHRLVCRHRGWNDLLTNVLCFWPLWVDLERYRPFHFGHHRHTGGAEDPELAFKQGGRHWYALPVSGPKLFACLVLDLIGGGAREVLSLLTFIGPASLRGLVGPVLWWAVATGACLASDCWQALALWFGAMFTSHWALFRLRMWFEHVGTAGTHRVELRWWQKLLFSPHNVGYHWEHHHWPAVPFYRLPMTRDFDRQVPVLSVPALLDWFHHPCAGAVPPGLAAQPEAIPRGVPRMGEFQERGQEGESGAFLARTVPSNVVVHVPNSLSEDHV
jgi:fatty acid desaturase